MIHSDFLVEVVIVLRDVSGGGYGCGFLGLPLVVVDSGFTIGGGGAIFGSRGFIFFVWSHAGKEIKMEGKLK